MKIGKKSLKIIVFCLSFVAFDANGMEAPEIELSNKDVKILKSIRSTASLLSSKEVKAVIDNLIDSYLKGEREVQVAEQDVILSSVDRLNLSTIKEVSQLLQNELVKDRIIALMDNYLTKEGLAKVDIQHKKEELFDAFELLEKDRVLKIVKNKDLIQKIDALQPGDLLMEVAGWDDEVVQAILDVGLKPNVRTNYEYEYPLHKAAANGKGKIVKLLLNAGAIKEQKNSENKTAYDLAQDRKNAMLKEMGNAKQDAMISSKDYVAPYPFAKKAIQDIKDAIDLLVPTN